MIEVHPDSARLCNVMHVHLENVWDSLNFFNGLCLFFLFSESIYSARIMICCKGISYTHLIHWTYDMLLGCLFAIQLQSAYMSCFPWKSRSDSRSQFLFVLIVIPMLVSSFLYRQSMYHNWRTLDHSRGESTRTELVVGVSTLSTSKNRPLDSTSLICCRSYLKFLRLSHQLRRWSCRLTRWCVWNFFSENTTFFGVTKWRIRNEYFLRSEGSFILWKRNFAWK